MWHLTNPSMEVLDSVTDYLMNDPEDDKSPLAEYAAFRWTRDMLRDIRRPPNISATQEYISQRIGATLVSKAMILVPGLDPDFLTRLSAERYESSSSKGLSIILFPSEAVFHKIPNSVAFHESDYLEFIPENAHAVRKQMSLSIDYPKGQGNQAKIEKWLLAAAYYPKKAEAETEISGKNTFRTVGIVSEGVLQNSMLNHWYRVSFPGHMHWELCFPTQKKEGKEAYSCLVQYRGGLMHFPDAPLERVFSDCFKNTVSMVFPTLSSTQQNSLLTIVLSAKKNAPKGTVLVFAAPEDIKKEVQRLVGQSKRGTHFVNDELYDLEKKLPALKSFTSVDGAVLIDTNGCCHAFGVILDGAVPPGEKGNPARGAKFNCSKTYICSRNFEALGVVLSEDGMVDLLRKAR